MNAKWQCELFHGRWSDCPTHTAALMAVIGLTRLRLVDLGEPTGGICSVAPLSAADNR